MAVESATLDIGQATSSNMDTTLPDVVTDHEDTDGAEQDETIYINKNWEKQFGYYNSIPDVKSAIDTRAIWTVGKKYTTSDVGTDINLERITGWGEDTFQEILQNMVTVKRISGDSFAEIMRDADTKRLINLKPLNPGKIRIITDKKGILKRYEQITASGVTRFEPKDIFHLVNKRVADQIHGTSDIDILEPIIDASKEVFVDVRKLYHRYVKPLMKFELDTDDQTKIDAFIVKMDQVVEKGENIYIPKDTVTHDLVTVPSSATLSPFSWIDHLNNKFYQVVGIPQIILGNAAEFSESSAKIAYLSFQQSVEAEQLQIEAAVWKQLKLKIKLEFPATIQNEMISDTKKDGANADMGMQPNDTALTMGQQEGAQ